MTIEAIAILSTGLVLFFVSLPLVFRKVPMNSIYGIRIPAAFESDERWYDINAYGGRQMAIWSLLIVAAGVAGFFLPENDASIYMPVSTVIVLVAILIPLARITRWSRRAPKLEGADSKTAMNEVAQTADAFQKNNFLNKRMLVPAIVLAFLCAGFLVFVHKSASWLPERVATHFGASGQADGWMQRASYLHFIVILGLTIAIAIAVLAVTLDIFRASLKSSRSQNLSWLCGDILWLACLILCFIAGTHYSTIEANLSRPAHLPSGSFAVLIAGFSAGNIGWIILFCFHLMKKSSPSSVNKTNSKNKPIQSN